jgi:hypothetical protein
MVALIVEIAIGNHFVFRCDVIIICLVNKQKIPKNAQVSQHKQKYYDA